MPTWTDDEGNSDFMKGTCPRCHQKVKSDCKGGLMPHLCKGNEVWRARPGALGSRRRDLRASWVEWMDEWRWGCLVPERVSDSEEAEFLEAEARRIKEHANELLNRANAMLARAMELTLGNMTARRHSICSCGCAVHPGDRLLWENGQTRGCKRCEFSGSPHWDNDDPMEGEW